MQELRELELDLTAPEQLQRVARALGSELRIRILELLDERTMSVVELAQHLDMPVSTVSNNIIVLEEAGLIRTSRQAGAHGVMKLCSRKRDQVTIRLTKPRRRELRSFYHHMPIGCYTDCRVEPTCGLLGTHKSIGRADDLSVFYDPEHFGAQLLWFQKGYVEYRFSNQALQAHAAECLEVSFEACSEAPGYRMDWPSDITVWINEVELGTWRCPGDFGGRQGHNGPDWWPLSSTQYGLLKRWRVDHTGCYLDDAPISDVTLGQLRLLDRPYISLRIGIRSDAECQGGINLFGEHFGDHNQSIIMRLDCLEAQPPERRDNHDHDSQSGASQT